MFKKLLGNLPFSPSLIGQVALYAKQLKFEMRLRKWALLCLTLATLLQLFVALSPVEPSLAESGNDILRGGFSSQEQASEQCRSNSQQFALVLAYHGVSCDALTGSSVAWIQSTDYSKSLLVLGRHSYGPVVLRTGKPTGEFPVPIGDTTYFARNLWAWDSGSPARHKVLEVKNVFGGTVMILLNSGNVVTLGRYSQPAGYDMASVLSSSSSLDKCIAIPGTQYSQLGCGDCLNVLTINSLPECGCSESHRKSVEKSCFTTHQTVRNQTQDIKDAHGTTVKPSDVLAYTLRITNNQDTPVRNMILEDNFSDVLQYADIITVRQGKESKNGSVQWRNINIAAGGSKSLEVVVKVKDPIPLTPVSSSDPGAFDLTLSNTFYGTSTSVVLPASIVKKVEMFVNWLPRLNSETGVGLAVGLSILASFFWLRTRLLFKELSLVKEIYDGKEGQKR